MNKIEKLINELCPSGTKRMKIKDICSSISSGGTPKRDEESYYNGTIPWLRTQEVDFNEIFDTGLKITEEGLKNSSAKYIKENCVIIAMYGATAGKVAINKIPLTTNQACCNLEINPEIANYKYVYHWLFKNYQNLKALGQGSQSNINSKIVKDFIIPIPPLEIQEEIVKILDKFTDYVTELTTELTLRQKQYDYYLNKILSFENQTVEKIPLGNLFVFKNGLNKGKEFFGNGTPIVNYTDVYKNIKLNGKIIIGKVDVTSEEQLRYDIRKGDVFFTRTSETKEEIGKTSVLLEDIQNGVFSGFVLRARPITDLLLPEYCAYCFNSSDFRKNIIRFSTYTTRALTNGKTLSKLTIPVPSIAVQREVVNILDNLYSISNDMSTGLPKEIELRQKQYEYYRDKLLTFD